MGSSLQSAWLKFPTFSLMKHVIVLYLYKDMSLGDSMKTYPTLQKALQTYKIGRFALFFHRCESIALIIHVDGVEVKDVFVGVEVCQ